jgi:hypothetical protein
MWMICLDTNLNEFYQAQFGGSADDIPSGISQQNRGSLVIASNSNSNISGNKTVNTYSPASTHWLLKLDVPLLVKNQELENKFNAYPNPFSQSFTLKLGENSRFDRVEVLDVMGKVIFSENISGLFEKTIVLPNNLGNGLYHMRLSGDGVQFSQKMLKQD